MIKSIWTAALVCGLVAVVAGPAPKAFAADLCNAVALVDVPDWGGGDPSEASGSVLKKGEIDEAVTEYVVSKTTGAGTFCSHGGYCYPRYLTVNGQKVEALRLTNCKIGAAEASMPGVDDQDIIYDVIVDRSKNSPAALRLDDIDNALLNLGMCAACAGNAADIYVKNPQSRCGTTVKKALSGDKSAISALQADPTYCDESSPGWASASDASDQSGTSGTTPEPVADTPAASQPPSPAASPPAPPATRINPIEVALAVVAILYFVPALIGFLRRKRNAMAIFAMNLFLGWTFLGWVGALIWSLLTERSSERDLQPKT